MSEYIKKEDILLAAVEVEYLNRPRMMVSVAKIGQMQTVDIVRCKECKHCYVDGEQVKFNACELNHNKVQSDDWFCADGEREVE